MTSTNLATIHNQIAQIKTRFGTLRSDIIEKLNECNACINSAEELYGQVTEMATHLEEKLTNVSNEEKEWKETKIKLGTTLVKGMVILNVGGDRFTTSVETLIVEKATFFTALFSKQWQLERNPKDDSIFIDRNGKLFTHILEYLRTNVVLDDVMKNETLRQKLIIEARYFRLHSLIEILTEPDRSAEIQLEKRTSDFLNGTLLTMEQEKKLNEFYGKSNQKWDLIYRGSRDGFDSNAFHTRCDNQGSTMTVVRSTNNYLFGGYASVGWTSTYGAYINDPRAFLFTLTNPHNIPPTKYLVKPDKVAYALQYSNDYGPIFGGCDITLFTNSNSNQSSLVNFPYFYVDTTGQAKNTFTGTANFTTLDIEVFKVC
ncbi:unnamed protein product [Rotaria magnacalcarata]|uniref:TLDc domain-containing protein n=1 Tax=Rotaria magnacalcarata TaxID=392030 RepID=A0A816ZU65_9BILA|nr:unnamed protein product [Rotaria magnacalcarata]CAF4016504.1 unnamed protein product [Rotaria magnacalcarata]